MQPDPSLIGALNRQPTNLNPASGLQFKFVIRKIPNVNFTVQSVNIPSLNLAAVMQPTPLQNLPLPGTTLSYDNLNLTFILDEKFANYFELFTWINGLGFPKDFHQYASLKNEMRDVSSKFGGIWSDAILHVLTNESNPILNFIFRDAFPVSLGPIQFDTRDGGPAWITCAASFKYALTDFEYVT